MSDNKNGLSYRDVLESFGRDKVAKRFDNLMEQLNEFIKRKSYDNNVRICESAVEQAVIDYFTDLYRMKCFHKLDLANYVKITAYMAYWLVRRKPLQVIEDDKTRVGLVFCNEDFVLSFIMRFLQKTASPPFDDDGTYKEFISTLSYTLRYRTLTPQMLELMITGFRAGSIYQRDCCN